MLILFETSGGYALFKALEPGKLTTAENAVKAFATPEAAQSAVKLKAFSAFENTAEAVVAATSIIEGTLDKSLKAFLKKQIIKKELTDELVVADNKLGGLINSKLEIKCAWNEALMEVFRGIRQHMDALIPGVEEDHMQLQLGLSHSLSRYKLKFSADKVDIMIVQAIGLLDDLDKEINIYAMRVREWYGWHFPEMAKVVNDNSFYARCVLRMGFRTNCKNCDFSDILGDENMEEALKKSAETSMGTEISDTDLLNIKSLCEQVVSLSEYRLQLFEYLRNRMAAIAPNLTVMVGELVGARLIAHSGSLLNLAKHPASTIQILGAEKALFRALKTKTDTPKYGLIYHASLIGQSAPKIKGKISRVLAAKTALAIRVDALGDSEGPTISLDGRAKVEARIRQLEGGQRLSLAAPGNKLPSGPAKYDSSAARALAPPKYNDASDIVLKKRLRDEDEEAAAAENGHNGDSSHKKKSKKSKVLIEEIVEEEGTAAAMDVDESGGEKKKKKKKDKQKE
jgi:nucleolar protein 58